MSLQGVPVPAVDDLGVIRCRAFNDIAVSDTVSMERTLTAEDVELFSMLIGATEGNGAGPDGRKAVFARAVAPGMLAAALILGEHSAVIRERVMAALAYPDVVPAAAANFDNAPVISAPQSRVRVVVEPTNEEWVAARHALACTQGG